MKKFNLKETENLRDTRLSEPQNKDDFYYMNFVKNFHRVLSHLRQITDKQPSLASKETKRQFVIGLATCIETFFRDMFVYALDKEPDLVELYLKDNIKVSLKEVIEIQKAGITWNEYIASLINFQSLVEIDDAFKHIFSDKGSLSKKMNSYQNVFTVPSKGQRGLFKIPEDWWTVFDKMLQLRHRLVHDANYNPEIETIDLAKFESYILLVAQICNMVMFERFKAHGIVVDQDGYPVLLLIEDVLGEWRIVEKDELKDSVPKETQENTDVELLSKSEREGN